jgi:cytochrome c-type biogenesis protein CcmF
MGTDPDGTTAIKVLVNPMMAWVWIGGFFFMAGGIVALWPDRKQSLVARG